jgi:hypothetical protein
VKIQGKDIGDHESAFDTLQKQPGLDGSDADLAALPDTPFETVVRGVDALRRVAFGRILFRGTAPPPARVRIEPGEETIIEDPVIEDRPAKGK